MTEALTHLTRRAALGVSLGAMAVVACGRDPLAADATQRADLEAVFAESGVAGTFVLYEVEADQLTLIAGERAQTRLVPASTFKIANTIIALETGVVKDENEVIPYGGRPQPFKTWEKNMSMREAIALSAVPIYQALARDIIRLESRDGKVLYGKTGWRFSSTPNLGWWTGWVERNGKISAFALNIDMPAASDASKRVVLGKAMLAKLGI